MSFTLIGFIVGLLMGVTGAGGAIIAIPLFQLLNGSTLKEATVLSLITVLMGTGINLASHFKNVKWNLALSLAISGTVANYLSLPIKTFIPEAIIVLLLVTIGVFSIWSVWKSSPEKTQSEKNQIHPLIIILTGFFLGLITTLTGLGGGVLLIPLLLHIFRMDYEEAIPTSLSSIFLISFSSLLIQGAKTLELMRLSDFFLITTGGIIAFICLNLFLKKMSKTRKLKLRKYVFTIATITSLIIVILKTL